MSAILTVGCAFSLSALTVGPMKSLGIFFVQYERELGATAGQASLVNSLAFGAYFLGGPFASILTNRLGFRQTIILGTILASVGFIGCSFSQHISVVHGTVGIMTGVGFGFVGVPTVALIGMRFKEKQSLYINIVTMGSALSAIPLSPLLQLWIDIYGWRGAYLLLGGVVLNAIPSCFLMVSSKINKKMTNANRKLIDLDLMRSYTFPVYAIASGCDMAAMVAIGVYLVRFAQYKEVDNYIAASLPSIVAVVDLILRPISGYVTTLTHIGNSNKANILWCVACIQAVAVFIFPFTQSVYAIIAVTVTYATCVGSRGALAVTILSDLFGTEKLVSSLGLRAVVVGIFIIATPPLIGIIVDLTGSYDIPFYASSMLSLVSAFLVAFLQIITPNEKQNGIHSKAKY
uniref:LOW QUALITY PROTEIN: monocarboxylate transporter 12-B-like n=1 Tax=Styela clava TaxID=7725 RepID=UPI00193ADBA2|nr:LOW QUALITY PROTEIN: monocarboxylate transporter 12-B-like [Styela clava]